MHKFGRLPGTVDSVLSVHFDRRGRGAMFTDFTLALRQLRRSPGFTMTAALTLALGIGATTAIFSLVEQVMLRSLPVTKPQELWRLGNKSHCCGYGGRRAR